MKLILNEKKILKRILEEGFVDIKKPTNTITILAKHYLSSGLSKKQTVNHIDSFLKNNYKEYNTVKWIDKIEQIVDSIHKNKNYSFKIVDEVIITKTELNVITKLNDEIYEKLAFSLLVYAKIYNKLNNTSDNWVNADLKDVFDDAKLKVKAKKRELMIFELKKLNLVEPIHIVDRLNIQVNFVDETSKPIIKITDFDNFIFYYLKWKGKRVIKCDNCGIMLVANSNNQKFCKKCSEKRNDVLNKERCKKYYRAKKVGFT